MWVGASIMAIIIQVLSVVVLGSRLGL
jgi:hypothetical protein